MNKKVIIGLVIGLGTLIVLVVISSIFPKSSEVVANNQKADKVEVFLFHATKRCITCITIGKLAGETVNEYFQPELRNGQIKFREINTDLSENKDLARKFQASGSSLFINAIINGKDNITEDTKVWRLVSDKAQFKNYLKDKIDNLLGR